LLYEKTYNGQWMLVQTLEASNPYEGDYFGDALALNQNTMVVNASHDNTEVGFLHVLHKSNGSWIETSILTDNDDPDLENSFFGNNVAIAPGIIAATSRKHIHIFENSSTNQDSDGDGIVDNIDNCPEIANPNQEDANSNGVGDVCDSISNPFLPIADQLNTCPIDGKTLAIFNLCNTGDSKTISINESSLVSSVNWEKLDDSSCPPFAENCANENLSCVWNTISTELTVSINETGSYRIVIGYIDGTIQRFYTKFNNSCQATLQFESDITIDESDGIANFAVSFSGEVSGGFTVDYNTSGISADNSTDFSGSSGTLIFSGTNGETQYINIPIIDDNLIEPQETFTVELSNVSTTEVSINGGTSTGTIIDNDLQTGMGISFTNSNITVNEDEGFATLTVSLTGNSQESFTVDYTTSNGSAQQPDDFTSTSGQLTFPAFTGSSQMPLFR
jgi:hypothetical protein